MDLQNHLPSASVFNAHKSDYERPEIILGEAPGLIDSINRPYPEIFKLYKEMKSMDWDENEYAYSKNMTDFEILPPHKVSTMIDALAWQWETDSMANRSITTIMGLYNPCDDAWLAWGRITDNEGLHGLTYSEIVRLSMKDPRQVLQQILAVKEALGRMSVVSKVFHASKIRGLQFQLGQVPNDQETYNHGFLFIFTLFVMERLQFMVSFASTFALGEEGDFDQICKGVQKIANDEYQIHVEVGRECLREMLATPRGKRAYIECRSTMEKIVNEVVATELSWNQFAFRHGHSLKHLNQRLGADWVKFCAHQVVTPFSLECTHGTIANNPLPYMSHWVNLDSMQNSPQTGENGQYKVTIMHRDDDDANFDEYDL